jgi:hypothetical protein
MPINFRISALVPVGLIVESVAQLEDSICNRSGRYPGGELSSVWIAFATRSQSVCSRGFGPAVFWPERTASGRDAPVSLRHPALSETDLRRTL